MTKHEYRALRLLVRHNGPMRSTYLAEQMGWGRTSQGQARLGGGYFRHLQKKGWVDCGYRSWSGLGTWGYFAGQITDQGRTALGLQIRESMGGDGLIGRA